jgi:protein gp37
MNRTGISWTDLTWNPVSGCSKVSPGCQNCYAEAWSNRFHGSFEIRLNPERLKDVEKIPSGSKVFVNSMSDLFHPNVSTDFVNDVLDMIEDRDDVVFQILTKRPEEIELRIKNGLRPIPDNVWLGVSVELRKYIGRIDELVASEWEHNIHSSIKFVSFEPLLGDIGAIKFDFHLANGIDWIIIGGESGPHHRPMDIEWARSIVKQAKEQGVAVWMKQLGGLHPGGDLEDFPEDLRIREFPESNKIGMEVYA